MHTCVRFDSLPESIRAEVLRPGKPCGVRVEIEVSVLNRILKSYPQLKINTPKEPKQSWPLWARSLATMKSETDKGVGDTAEWVFGRFGGSQFKKAVKKLGINCGCGERKEDWNGRYPYPKENL